MNFFSQFCYKCFSHNPNMMNFVISIATFKKMLVQKRREQMKEWEKQEKRIKEMKASGKSKKQAVNALFFISSPVGSLCHTHDVVRRPSSVVCRLCPP